MQLHFDIMSNMILDSVSTSTGVGCLKTNSNCLWTARASSNRSAKAITSADNTENATRHDFYDLYETGIPLWLSSVRRTMRTDCDNKSAILANSASPHVVIPNEL